MSTRKKVTGPGWERQFDQSGRARITLHQNLAYNSREFFGLALPDQGKASGGLQPVIPEAITHPKVETIFRSLLEAAPDAIVVVDADGRIVFVNARTETLFGYEREQLLGQSVEQLVPARFREGHINHRRAFTAESRIRPMGAGVQLYGQRKDGTEFPVDISLSPLETEEGKLLLSAIRDVSARVALQAQLDESRMQVVSSARLSALGMMAGGIAHEINNPLGIIHAYASNLLEMANDNHLPRPEVERLCSRILATTERIASIVKSLRQIAREGSGDALAPASVGEMIEQALELCQERFRLHSIRLVPAKVDFSLRVRCREVQIVQILLNLLQNAFDAISCVDGDRWITIEVGVQQHNVVLSVIDSGRGIAPELRKRIMEPFFTTKQPGKGTGLGLSISRSIAMDHGGELRYEERDGHTCFSLILPALEEEPSLAP
jgi:PAS domain S-box-containing protein